MNHWAPALMSWPLQNSDVRKIAMKTERHQAIDLIASFLKMKAPRGQTYTLQDLSPVDFEYKLVATAFVGTGTPEFDH